ncbi:MAG: hypothetical protein WDN04_14075 [Rhodospirillales bacterium]
MRLLDQMELGLEELESAATEDEITAEQAAARHHQCGSVHAVAARRANRSPRICHASVWLSWHPPPACAAAAPGCASWARTSPRPWR